MARKVYQGKFLKRKKTAEKLLCEASGNVSCFFLILEFFINPTAETVGVLQQRICVCVVNTFVYRSVTNLG